MKGQTQKLDLGGAIQETLDKPALYQSMAYVSTRPALPDLEAIGYLQQRKAANEAKIEAERLKLHPDKEALAKIAEKVVGLNGQVKDLFGRYLQKVSAYEAKARSGNDIFSPEMRNELNAVNNFITTDDLNKLKNNKENIDKQFDYLDKKGLSSSTWVNDKGEIALRNAHGEVKNVAAAAYYEQLDKNPTLAGQDQILTNDQIKLHYYDNVGYDHKDWLTLSGQNNMMETNQEIDSYFKDLGSKDREVLRDGLVSNGLSMEGEDIPTIQSISGKYGSNSEATQAAYRLAYHHLSAKSKSAIMSDMISKGYDPGKINAFLNNRLTDEKKKREKVEGSNKISNELLPQHMTDGKKEEQALAEATPTPANEFVSAIADTNGFTWSHSVDVPITLVASPLMQPKPNQTIPTLELSNATVYRLGDGSVFSSDYSSDGQPVRIIKPLAFDKEDPQNTSIHYLKNVSVPVSNGKVTDANGNLLSGRTKIGSLITLGKASPQGLEKQAYQEDANGERYYESDGAKERYYFTDRAASIYKQGDDTIIKLMSRQESLKAFGGKNLTDERSQNEYFGKKGAMVGRTPELLGLINGMLQKPGVDEVNRAIYEQALKDAKTIIEQSALLNPNQEAVKKARQRLEPFLEDCSNKLDHAKILKQEPKMKTEYTANPGNVSFFNGIPE